MNDDWLNGPILASDDDRRREAEARQQQLTKPPGSLGRLEALAVRLAGLQRSVRPSADNPYIAIFAADHGVVDEGVSAFPPQVTGQMLLNFVAGGAAISVLARRLDATLELFDVGTLGFVDLPESILQRRAGSGSANLRREDAMQPRQLSIALAAGAEAAQRAHGVGADLFIGGDMGIGNTTAAAALGCALLSAEPAELAGPGTGLDAEGVAHKAQVIADALVRCGDLTDPLTVLRRLGGFEIAALTGAYIRCAQLGLPVLVDGYITTAAALVAVRHAPAVRDWLLFSHRSAEPGHRAMLDALQADPLLDLGMRLGEGSGAAAAVPLLQAACALHNGMATFADAGVSEGRG